MINPVVFRACTEEFSALTKRAGWVPRFLRSVAKKKPATKFVDYTKRQSSPRRGVHRMTPRGSSVQLA